MQLHSFILESLFAIAQNISNSLATHDLSLNYWKTSFLFNARWSNMTVYQPLWYNFSISSQIICCSKFISTNLRPFVLKLLRRHLLLYSFSIASTILSILCSTKSPVSPSIIESIHPVTLVVIIGYFIADASSTEVGKPSR